MAKPSKMGIVKLKEQFEIQSMVIPGMIFLIIFNFVPMIGIITAFIDYDPVAGYLNSPFVGLKYIFELFSDDAFGMILRNTLGMNLIGLAVSFPATILFALLLNEVRFLKVKKTIQSLSYLPHFLSWAIYGGILLQIFSTSNDGLVNSLLLNFKIIGAPINFFGEPDYYWAIIILSSLFKGLGWGSIIYIAAIAGVNPELYEAADMDGAGRFRKMLSITLPGISSTVVIMLVLAISGILNSGVDATLVTQNNMNYPASETIDMYVYHVGLQNFRFSYSTAIGLLKSVVSVVLLLFANKTSKKITERGLF